MRKSAWVLSRCQYGGSKSGLANVATSRTDIAVGSSPRELHPRRGIALMAAAVSILVLSAISVSLVRTVLARVQAAGQ